MQRADDTFSFVKRLKYCDTDYDNNYRVICHWICRMLDLVTRINLMLTSFTMSRTLENILTERPKMSTHRKQSCTQSINQELPESITLVFLFKLTTGVQ